MLLRAIVPLQTMSYINRTITTTIVQNVRHHFSSTNKPSLRPAIKKQLTMDSLPDYRLPHDIIEYESGKIPSNLLQDKLIKWENNKSLMRANESNYIESLRLMIYLEEAADQVQVEKCNQKNVKLHHVDDNEFYFFVKPEMKDLYALIKQFDEFVLHSEDGSRVTDGEIISKENNNNPNYYSNGKSEGSEYNCTQESSELIDDLDLNEEQRQAVANIVHGEFYPLPYLLYGPPGTGKTKTLVASIINIVRTSDENILVCTQSNAACDEITVRLKEFLDESVMFRMYTKSKDMKEISKSLTTFSNSFGGELKHPPLKYIYKFRVVICTLATAGCLTRAHCNPSHFNYVIIDECASAVEAIALVPIVGLCTTGRIHTKIVLAGDPKQLDAVTKSQTAAKLGYSTSFLEHLFDFPLYKRDDISGKFNTKFITQLVKNYRSHPVILHVPNQLFYEGVLKAETVPQIADLNIGLPKLNPDFPIIFKSVQGLCIKPEDDTSSYNVEEIVEVMAFIRTILNNNSQLRHSDVGVISPYRLQCEFIRLICKRNGFEEITVGTAEKFQGQERKIIIASTVCSHNEALGSFVSDPQRLNVMMTRAQYLLIVVGDPHTLNTSPHWHEFIKYCYTNGSLIQSDNSFLLYESGTI